MALQTYIAEGFMEDCEELMHALTEKYQKVDWHKFCNQWKEMQFDLLFYGRQSGPEVVEFTEELLQTARLYIITETDNFEYQVIGVFIAYAIIIIQPYNNLCALRLVPEDVASLKKIEAIARRDNRRDVLMILGKLYIYGNTQFHVSVRERAMDMSIRKYFDDSTIVPQCIARRWHGRLDRHRIKALEEIAQAEIKYKDLKKTAKVAAEAAFPGTNVQIDVFKPGAKHMAESLRKLISGAKLGQSREDDETNVNAVKRKAMKKTVDPMRHLHGLDQRQKEKEKEKELQTKSPAKVKVKKKCRKLSPKPDPEPFRGFSLPDLIGDVSDDQADIKREGSPEAPFRGFTTKDVQLCDSIGTIDLKSKLPNNSQITHSKGKGMSSSNAKPADKSLSVNKSTPKGRSPRNGTKRNSISQPESSLKKKKKKLKNKFNKKLRLSNDFFNSDDSDTLLSDKNYTSDEAEEGTNDKALHLGKNSDTEPCKGKELTIQTKGVVKHFVEFEVSDIVIRTEKNAPPVKDIEIEYIDNYRGANDLYEEVCEVSDDECKKVNKAESSDDEERSINDDDNTEVQIVIEECDEFGDDKQDDIIEVFQVISEEPDESIERNRVEKQDNTKLRTEYVVERKSAEETEVENTVQKILNKDKTKHNIERRKLKQPNLRSKLKKMGLLPVANFDDDSS